MTSILYCPQTTHIIVHQDILDKSDYNVIKYIEFNPLKSISHLVS